MVRRIVRGIVHMNNPKKLWVIPLNEMGKRSSRITSISGMNVLIQSAVPSNLYGYFILINNAGAW
jgi:hypothetical protein